LDDRINIQSVHRAIVKTLMDIPSA